jgi:hypothetical protein
MAEVLGTLHGDDESVTGGDMKSRSALSGALAVVAFALVGCQATTTVSGTIVPIDGLEIPRGLSANVILFDAGAQETKQELVRIRRNGRFTTRVSGQELYLFSISIPGDRFNLSTDWIESAPILLQPGQTLNLTDDLFLSVPFDLRIDHEALVLESIEQLRVSWSPVEFAQLYVLSIVSVGDTQELVRSFVTQAPSFDGGTRAPMIPTGSLGTMTEIAEESPFYRVREAVTGGHYEIWVDVFRETERSFISRISTSRPASIQLLN